MIQINKWNETFENADTRKRQRLGWVNVPTGCDSNGYRKLMRRGTNGILALGVFQALCQFTATLPREHRGKMVNSNGSSMELADISEVTRMPLADLQQALADLQEVGWISLITQQNASDLPEPADDLPTICHLPPGFVQGEVKGKGEGEGKEPAPALASSPSFAEFDDEMPTNTSKEFDAIQRKINALNPRWKAIFTYQELNELKANGRFFFDLSDDDWRILTAYMHAVIPEGLGKFWRPSGRSKVIQQISDLMALAGEWKSACKRKGIPTGLETPARSA